MSKSIDYEAGFPDSLWQCERAFLIARRHAVRASGAGRPPDDPHGEQRPPADATGVALSGGGIRSATFCLGVFQALAKRELIGRIDYLSTVSGGGYFGAFLCALFARPAISDVRDVEDMLRPGGIRPSPTASSAAVALGLPDVLRWLRENGRYVSANGSGDVLVNAAMMLRNWVTIHLVLAVFALVGFLLLQMCRAALPPALEHWFTPPPVPPWSYVVLPFWWSPFSVVGLVPLLIIVVPCAGAYWLVGASRTKGIDNPLVGLALVGVVVLALVTNPDVDPRLRWLGFLVLGEVVLMLLAWFVAWRMAHVIATDAAADAVAGTADEGFVGAEVRHVLSLSLMLGLLIAIAVFAVGLLDSVGQSVYLALRGSTAIQLGGVVTVLVGLAGVGQRVALALGRGIGGARGANLPLLLFAGVGGIAVIAAMLLVIDTISHAVAWSPCVPPVQLSWARHHHGPAATCPMRNAGLLAAAWVPAVLFSLVAGRMWRVLNNSSLHSMYSSRLTRVFLGASNPARARSQGTDITRVRPGDNFTLDDYWAPPGGREVAAPCDKGAPLHLISVTVNETFDARSRVQQKDRTGTGLALGPCAFSLGVCHHAVFQSHAALHAGSPPFVAPTSPHAYRVFGAIADGGAVWRGGERLTLGQWIGISGAAFSTGLGDRADKLFTEARRGLALSLLCGLANIRLGYWWESGVHPPDLPIRRSVIRRGLERLFPLQMFLLKEFISQFPGTAYTRWYLSDGGHFENTGGYELIRRRLPRMLIIDAEADPEYAFEGLANLVRKARLDFGADIAFLSAEELDAAVPTTHRQLLGSLDDMRRGRSGGDPAADDRPSREPMKANAPAAHSRAHAALARVTWPDEPAYVSWLLYLKPTLTGDERTDVLEYHRSHPTFPQETTGDQTFDEAQWESYRMLGFEIADALFAPGAPDICAAQTGGAPSPRTRIFG